MVSRAGRDYVLWDGRGLKGLPSKVNLIPFNEHEDAEFERPTDAEVETFKLRLLSYDIPVMVLDLNSGGELPTITERVRSWVVS